MATIYISLGSNIEPEKNLSSAVAALKSRYAVARISSVYRSAAVGMDADEFLNAVLVADTPESALTVTAQLRLIEDAHGRDRTQPQFSSRTLDLDLLLYNDAVVNDGGLSIPREDITEYAFVLQPLVDVAGELDHPVIGQTFSSLLEQMKEESPSKFVTMRVDPSELSV